MAFERAYLCKRIVHQLIDFCIQRVESLSNSECSLEAVLIIQQAGKNLVVYIIHHTFVGKGIEIPSFQVRWISIDIITPDKINELLNMRGCHILWPALWLIHDHIIAEFRTRALYVHCAIDLCKVMSNNLFQLRNGRLMMVHPEYRIAVRFILKLLCFFIRKVVIRNKYNCLSEVVNICYD